MCVFIDKVIQELSSLKEILTSTFNNDETKIDVGNINDEISDEALAEEEKRRVRNIVIIEKFTKSGIEIYKNLNFSVISGSYVQNKQFEDKIKECQTLINELRTLIPEGESISDDIDAFFCRLINASLKDYQYCVHTFHFRTSQPGKSFLLSNLENETIQYKIPTKIDVLNPYYELFYYNIFITYIDKNLSFTPHILTDLVDTLYQLKNHKLQDETSCKILIDKCTLLIVKFKLKYDNDDSFQSIVFSHDFTDEEFNPNTLKTTYLSNFQNIILSLYEENNDFLKEYYSQHREKLLNFTDYFICVRYYSKVEENYAGIEKLINDFKEQFKECECGFDEYSYKISLNYLYNNKVSFFYSYKLHEYNLEKINDIYEELKRIQLRTNVKNYFPFYKLACCYSEFIEKELIKNDTIQEKDLSKIRIALNQFQENLNFMEKYLEWAKRYDFLPYQPQYKDCCTETEIEKEKLNIFLASAYVIPIDITNYRKKLKALQAKVSLYTSILEMKDISIKEHAFVQEVHNEAKESQKNNIQILSVFAALVIFAAGNMQIFKTVETLKEAIIFMLTLAYALCLFSVVIWFIVSYKKKFQLTQAHKSLILCLFIGLVFSICAIFMDWGNKNIAYSKEKQTNTINVPIQKD